jgi:hypothetical protein
VLLLLIRSLPATTTAATTATTPLLAITAAAANITAAATAVTAATLTAAVTAPSPAAPAAAPVVEVAHTPEPTKCLNVHCTLLVHVAAVHELAALVAIKCCRLVEGFAGDHVKEVILVVCCGVRLHCLLCLTQCCLLVEVLVGLHKWTDEVAVDAMMEYQRQRELVQCFIIDSTASRRQQMLCMQLAVHNVCRGTTQEHYKKTMSASTGKFQATLLLLPDLLLGSDSCAARQLPSCT